MSAGPSDHVAVPDRPREPQLLVHIEGYASGIEQSADHQQGQGDGARAIDQRLYGQDDDPAEREIGGHPEAAVDHREEHLAQGAEQGDRPDRYRHAPGPGAGQGLGRERGVGACDHQEDAGVVQASQNRPILRLGEVVGGREAKHRQQAHGVDTDGYRLAERVILDGQDKQHDAADQGQGQADDMDDQIGALRPGGRVVARRDRRGLVHGSPRSHGGSEKRS